MFAGTEVHHAKGQKTQILYNIIELRKKGRLEQDEVINNYFAEFEDIYAQPAGFEDPIISKWKVERLSILYPCSISIKDAYLGARTRSTTDAMFLANMMDGKIEAHMTACMQVSDTTVIFVLKCEGRSEEESMRREMIEIYRESGVRAEMQCGPYEWMRISGNACARARRKFEGNELLVACIQNCLLVYRPDFERQCLVPITQQQWFKDLRNTKGEEVKLGSHRLKAEWVSQRYSWLDPDTGRPIPKDFSLLITDEGGKAKSSRDLCEGTYVVEPDQKEHLTAWAEDPELSSGVDVVCLDSGDIRAFEEVSNNEPVSVGPRLRQEVLSGETMLSETQMAAHLNLIDDSHIRIKHEQHKVSVDPHLQTSQLKKLADKRSRAERKKKGAAG